MTNLKRSARTLNIILSIVFWVLVARGIFAAGYHIATLYKFFADPAALSGKMGLTMLAAVILIENHYHLPALLVNDTITQVSVSPELRPVWFIAAAVLSILSMVFRRGEELQTLADETL